MLEPLLSNHAPELSPWSVSLSHLNAKTREENSSASRPNSTTSTNAETPAPVNATMEFAKLPILDLTFLNIYYNLV